MLTKLTNLVKLHQKDIFLVSCIVLISAISFNLGKINAVRKIPISISSGLPGQGQSNQGQADIYSTINNKEQATTGTTQNQIIDRRVVASKNSDKYHFTWCSGAKQIKEENKIWFENEAAAQKAGYTKAGNCN